MTLAYIWYSIYSFSDVQNSKVKMYVKHVSQIFNHCPFNVLTSPMNQATSAPNITASLDSRSCHGIPMLAFSHNSCLNSSSFQAADPISNRMTLG